jgi:putative DNA primase/helicase
MKDMCLDEMGQVDSKEAGEIAYLLANGQANLRSSWQGRSLRSVMQFRVLFLSTGEIGLSEKNREELPL